MNTIGNFLSKSLDFFYVFKLNTKEALSDLFGLFYFKIYLLILSLALLINFSFAYFVFNKISPSDRHLIALHYNIYSGTDLIGSATNIFILPALGATIVFLNLSLFILIYKHKNSRFLGHFLLVSAAIANFFLFAGLISIYLVNFFF